MNNYFLIDGRDGVKIPAIFNKGDEDKPVVIMAHGLQGSKDEYLDTQRKIADSLLNYGIGSLRIDFRGHGDSESALSEFSLSTQVSDLNSSVIWLKNNCRNLQIIPLGISFGAPPSLILSELYRSITNKCILIAPVVDYSATFLYPKTTWGINCFGIDRILDGIRKGKLRVDEGYELERPVLVDILTCDIPAFVGNTKFNISIFHGENDDMVPISSSIALAQCRTGIKFRSLPKTEHGLTETGDEWFSSPVTIDNLALVIQEVINS